MGRMCASVKTSISMGVKRVSVFSPTWCGAGDKDVRRTIIAYECRITWKKETEGGEETGYKH